MGDNRGNILVCLVTTCLECIYAIIEYISKFATLQAAMTGAAFCDAAANVTDLLQRNFLAAYGAYAFPGMILQGTAFVFGRVRRRDLAPVVRHVRRLRRRQRRFVRGAGRRARRRGGVRGADVLRDDHAERGGRRVPVLRHGQGPEPGPPPRVPRRVRGGEPESRAARRRRAESQRESHVRRGVDVYQNVDKGYAGNESSRRSSRLVEPL